MPTTASPTNIFHFSIIEIYKIDISLIELINQFCERKSVVKSLKLFYHVTTCQNPASV